MAGDPHAIAVVGAGPRGTSVLERLCASAPELAPGTPLTVHLVDPSPPGAGRVWRTAQPGELLMNTVASQVTLFTDASVECGGPVRTGPSLYEWVAACGLAPGLGPDDYPSRALYGRYLEWVFGEVVRGAPKTVTVRTHRARAVRLEERADGEQVLTLDDGSSLEGLSAVVLAQGHLPAATDATERRYAAHAERHGLRYYPPANPADVDLSPIAPGEPVLLRGLGLNFFDHMALLTAGRGGTFAPHPRGGLVYRPSGREPRLYAGSRRGIPYHARGDNAKGPCGRHTPLLLTPDMLGHFRKRADSGDPPDFLAEIWPLVAKEAETVYYEALLALRAPDTRARRPRKPPGTSPAPPPRSPQHASGVTFWPPSTAALKRPPCSRRTAYRTRSAGRGTRSPSRIAGAGSQGVTSSGGGCWPTPTRMWHTPGWAMSRARSRRPSTCCATSATRCGRSSTTAG
ncbi:hypothetical protein GCM10017744_069130 [Streptomyces antimycoticus]